MDKNKAIKLIRGIEEDGRNVTSEHIEALSYAVSHLEADRWIPVSERLPEPQKPNDDIYNTRHSDYVLVCIEWWNGQKVIDTACYIFDDEEWEYQGSDESDVIAWKHLPKPYESEAENVRSEN